MRMIDYRTEVVNLTIKLNGILQIEEIVEVLDSVDKYLTKYRKIENGKVSEDIFHDIVVLYLEKYKI